MTNASLPSPRANAAPKSLFQSGLGVRLALVAVLVVPLWAAIAWALATV